MDVTIFKHQPRCCLYCGYVRVLHLDRSVLRFTVTLNCYEAMREGLLDYIKQDYYLQSRNLNM